jgi:hypothetical protein
LQGIKRIRNTQGFDYVAILRSDPAAAHIRERMLHLLGTHHVATRYIVRPGSQPSLLGRIELVSDEGWRASMPAPEEK